MGQRIKQLMSNDKTQRLLYFLGIPLWTYLWYMDDLSEYPNKSLDIAWAIPTSLLLFQVIFNNKIMWTILFAIFAIYITAGTLGSTYGFITSAKISIDLIVEFIVFISVVTILTWTFYHMRPKRTETLKHAA